MRNARRRDARLAAALALLAALAGAAEVRAQDGAVGGTLRITADPPRLLLGRDGVAELRVVAPDEVEDLQLTASVGRIEDLRRLPEGGFAARYRPPAERVPQIAILAALGRTSRGAADGWLALPLSGQGDARVRAAAGTEITLRIGERTFGPRRTGGDGVAVIPVVVPPGVREAHHGFRPIDLHVPETPLVHAVLDRGVVFADRQERVRVLAFAVAPHGAARRGDLPAFEPSRGKIAVEEREPGVVHAVWTLPPGRAGQERLVVRLRSAPATRAVLPLEVVAGPPAVVAVSFDRIALVAGAEPVAVSARALDAGGNAVPAVLTMAAEGADLADVREPEPGVLEGLLRATAFGGRREVRVVASAPGAEISGARALPLAPGEAVSARFERASRVLPADGRRAATFQVSFADRYGNPVETVPTVKASRGKVVDVRPSGRGFALSYVPRAVTLTTPERLVASVGAVSATAEPVLVPPEPPVAIAASAGLALDLRGRSQAPRAGVVVARAMGPELARRSELELAWRAEGELGRGPDGAALTLLGGASASRRVVPSVVLRGSASAGAVAASGGVGPALRLAVAAGLAGRRAEPYLEAALLVAGRGGPGAFAAVGISAGLRLGLERR